jgi:pilus assembly protein Flp/PilA
MAAIAAAEKLQLIGCRGHHDFADVDGSGDRDMRVLRKFCGDKSGATAIEYGLIAALIAVGIIGGVSLLGGNLSNEFNAISLRLNTQ